MKQAEDQHPYSKAGQAACCGLTHRHNSRPKLLQGVFVMMCCIKVTAIMGNNVLKDTQGFVQHLHMYVYKISRSLAKEHMCTRIETEGKKKNSSLVYIRFGIGSNGNNQNKWFWS